MSRLFLAALAALVMVAAAPAQTLAHSISADSLVYIRSHSGDPIEAMKKALSGGGLWNEPVDVDSIIDMMDDGLSQASDMLDMGDISIGKWIRSIKGYEAALTRFVPMDGWPEFDFVLVFHTSMADEIYDLVSGKMIEEAMADEVSKDEMEMSMGEFSMNIGKHGDMIVVASDSRQLRETMKTFGSVKQGCLAQSKKFKRVLGSDTVPPYCVYVNATPWLRILKEEIDAGAGGGGMRMGGIERAAASLGMLNIGAIGWNELPNSSHLSILGNETIPMFDMLATGKGGKESLDSMPADVAVAVTWNGSGKMFWDKSTGFLLDEDKFPMAAMVKEQMIQAQKQLGLQFSEIAKIATGGISFAAMPDSTGRIDGDEDNFFVTIRTGDPATAQETIAQLLQKVVEPRGGEFTSSDEGGRTWFRITMPNARVSPCIVFDGDTIIIAAENPARKALDARAGNFPTLARYGIGKTLPKQASMYTYLGMKAIMGQQNDFAPAFANLRDGAGIAAAITVEPDRMTVKTSMPVSHAFGAFGAAGAMYESQRKTRTAVLADLKKIATAYREYRAKHDKDPTTLGQLGFAGETALSYPPNRPAGTPGKPYRLVSTQGGEIENGWNTVVVICPDNKLGRLVGTFDGRSRSLSEVRFKRAFQKQTYPK